ncbi:MAG TPA: CaiB/BaiF CoA-transferase family protein [Desulfomonilaceae bacterium]|nr:CaiB/BaiF CoA-transferase family protein [Desulfomonilaceae bacterium]
MSSALSGLKVLDLSMNLPGPYMTWLLALMGAEVVKVENPQGGDYARLLGGKPDSPLFGAVNRNKKSVALNLKDPKGKKIFVDLLDLYDVLVEGFRPGTLERLGLGFQTTSARNPRLIHVSITGYGHDGPYRLRAGHDVNYLSLAGILGITGTRDGRPVVPGIQIADVAGGSLLALSGLLAAIIQREKTGRGQFVDAAMFDGALSMATMIFGGIEAGLERPAPGRMLLNGRFPCYGIYETKDGKYMSLGALEQKFWQNFCAAVNRPDLVSGQFGGEEVRAETERVFISRTRDEWYELMKDADACCEPVLTMEEAMESPLTVSRNMVRRSLGNRRFMASPVNLSASPSLDDQPAPALGQHSREILTQLELSPDEFDSLVREGVVAVHEPSSP